MRRVMRHLALGVAAMAVTGSASVFAEEGQEGGSELDADATRVIDKVVTIGTLAEADANSALPLEVLSGAELANRRQGGLGETLAGLPGIHLDNFGGGASRPVIRGQTIPRIEILSDGANLYDVSSVAPDHAITAEPLLLDGIEVLRGSAAARYGGNALNGAINLIDGKIPKHLPEHGLEGGAEARFGTGDEEAAAAGRATLGLGQFALHVEGFRRASENYAVPDGFGSDKLKDSFSEGDGYSVGGSWITSKGYIGAAYSRLDSEYGLPGHSHKNAVCHTHGTDLHCAAHGGYGDPFGSSDDHTAKINLRADRIDVRADYADVLPGIQNARVRLSYTDYEHDEIDGPFIFTTYSNEVYDGRVELTHKPVSGFVGTFGVQYTEGEFTGINVNDLHEEFPENGWGFDGPSYHQTENAGIFLSEARAFGAVDLEFAIRKDWREIDVTVPPFRMQLTPEIEALYAPFFVVIYGENWKEVLEANSIETFKKRNPTSKHDPLSASIGATWNLDSDYSIALSLAHSERAPNIRELYAYGNNLATNSYEVGLTQSRRASSSFPVSTTDVLEKTDSLNLTFRKTQGPTQFEVGAFYMDVEDYIFARLIETDDETGSPHNYLLYVTADAKFSGIDGQISHQISQESRLTVFGDYVHTDMTSEDDELPRIPPARLGVRYELDKGPIFAEVEFIHTFDQDRIASYETETDSYNLVNGTVTYRLDPDAEKSTEFFLRGTNLFDELAYVHTLFVKSQSPLRGRNLVLGVRTSF